MRLLLDTHALLWWWLDDPNLPERVRDVIADESNEIFVSAASAWEMAIKHRIGKLGSVGQALPRFHELIQADGFTHLPMDWRHALKAGGHEHAHRDPFDRMLAAQAEREGLTLLSRDPAMAALGARTRW
ncbi:MAG: type II toxin-antitoxin system VapC family toxin [Pseudoxanthomonas suwonensis]|nr:type II toxin-antitoxin system VapC family toxin [Pseudoxanthomonas suwonensis]